jgi:hypothetical protein
MHARVVAFPSGGRRLLIVRPGSMGVFCSLEFEGRFCLEDTKGR